MRIVKDGEVHVFVIGRVVHCLQHLGLVEPLGKFVEVSEYFGSITPGRLHGRNGRGVIDEVTDTLGK